MLEKVLAQKFKALNLVVPPSAIAASSAPIAKEGWRPTPRSRPSQSALQLVEDMSKAVSKAGFTVAVRPLDLDTFMPVTVGSAYFSKVVDELRYYSQDKVLFRFVRTP